MKKYSPTTLTVLAFVGVFAVMFLIQQYYSRPSYTTMPVKRGTIVDEVYAVGKVEPVSDAYLFFNNPGKITNINVKVGDNVKPGDVLASQDTKDIKSQIVEINAGVNVQKAKIDQLNAGSSKEAIDAANTAVSNAVIALANAELSLKNTEQSGIDSLKSAFTTSDDIVRNKVDQMILNPDSSNPQLIFSPASNFGLGSDIQAQRVTVGVLLNKWGTRLDGVTTADNVFDEITYAKSQLSVLKQFIEKISIIVNNSINMPTDIPLSQWIQWRNDIVSARVTIDTLYSGFTTAQNAINSGQSAVKLAKGTLSSAKDQLQLATAGTRGTDLAVYQAQLAQAAAARSKVDALKQELTLVSPIIGQVSEIDGKVGEISGPSKIFITVLSLDNLEIKVNVVENNIPKVKIGQSVRVTFEAMPDKVFTGQVSAIDPAETEINGTVYYKTTVTLSKKEDFIRSGMTADVWINSSSADNALFVPVSSLSKKDDKTFVNVLDGGSIYQKEVEVGIRDSHGNVEIKSGLSEGQNVITETVTHGSPF